MKVPTKMADISYNISIDIKATYYSTSHQHK